MPPQGALQHPGCREFFVGAEPWPVYWLHADELSGGLWWQISMGDADAGTCNIVSQAMICQTATPAIASTVKPGAEAPFR